MRACREIIKHCDSSTYDSCTAPLSVCTVPVVQTERKSHKTSIGNLLLVSKDVGTVDHDTEFAAITPEKLVVGRPVASTAVIQKIL